MARKGTERHRKVRKGTEARKATCQKEHIVSLNDQRLIPQVVLATPPPPFPLPAQSEETARNRHKPAIHTATPGNTATPSHTSRPASQRSQHGSARHRIRLPEAQNSTERYEVQPSTERHGINVLSVLTGTERHGKIRSIARHGTARN